MGKSDSGLSTPSSLRSQYVWVREAAPFGMSSITLSWPCGKYIPVLGWGSQQDDFFFSFSFSFSPASLLIQRPTSCWNLQHIHTYEFHVTFCMWHVPDQVVNWKDWSCLISGGACNSGLKARMSHSEFKIATLCSFWESPLNTPKLPLYKEFLCLQKINGVNLYNFLRDPIFEPTSDRCPNSCLLPIPPRPIYSHGFSNN